MQTLTHLTPNQSYLNTEQAARYIGSKPSTLEHWRYVGGGPKYAKIGRRVAYAQSWLDEWVNSRAVTSTAESRRRGIT